MNKKVSDGKSTLFWLEKEHSQRNTLWKRKKKKSCTVADRLRIGEQNQEWKSYPNNEDQVNELDVITSWIGTFQPNNRSDNWVCTISRDGEFHVDCMRHI